MAMQDGHSRLPQHTSTHENIAYRHTAERQYCLPPPESITGACLWPQHNMTGRQGNTDPKRSRFRCSHHGCAYSFPKSEHLARHERTHSGSRPYSCAICHRRFARNDALVRHRRLHSQAAAGEASRSSAALIAPPGNPTDALTLGRRESPVSLSDATHHAIPHPAARRSDPSQGTVGVNAFPADGDAFWHDLFPLGDMPWEDAPARLRIEPVTTGFSPPLQNAFFLPVPDHNSLDVDTAPVATGNQLSTESPSAQMIHQAVESLNGILYTLPARLTMQMDNGDGCNFGTSLNDYLDIFLARFPSVLSLLHKPTFKISETAPSTLLLMLALGSNFLGTNEAVSKGESLWKLAHAVATTCWSTLVANRGPCDSCNGVQLVLTAALGQTYALMSRSTKLRTTAQVVHDLGFHWARQCGMYDTEYASYAVAKDESRPLVGRWRSWAASETQLRALLTHYILDGHIAQVSGESVCVRHSINPLPMPVPNAVFEAPDAHAWQTAMAACEPARITFREYILGLFWDGSNPCDARPLSETSIFVVLECFQSFASERQEAGGDAVGLPSRREVIDAMTSFYRFQIMKQSSQIQNDQALRWHSILGFSVCTNVRDICHQLCEVAGTPQPFFPHRKRGRRVAKLDDIWHWVNCQEGRTALLHSFAICDRINDLRLGHASGIHVPFAAFYAAVTMLAFLSTGSYLIAAPATMDWAANVGDEGTDGATNAAGGALSFINGVVGDKSVTRSLQVDVHGLRRLLRTLGETWGICIPMEATLKSLYEAVTWLSLVAQESFPRGSVVADETG